MGSFLTLSIVTLLVLYAGVLLAVIIAWLSMRQDVKPYTALKVSVIVPFRNEAPRLASLVESIKHQAYQQFEVLFINDHSSDTSLEVLQKALQGLAFDHKVITLDEGLTGKKAAIGLGVKSAKGEVILTTDADCVFGPEWISEMVIPFKEEKIKFVSGPVCLTGNSLFQKWQQMEFSVLIAVGTMGIRTKNPSMANGANLAYRKSIFDELRGFQGVDHIPSGDDELFMMKVHEAYKEGLCFRRTRKATVRTEALNSWREFENQRLRWASKWHVGKRIATMLTALFILIVNLSLVLLLPAVWFGWMDWGEARLVLLMRLVSEFLLVVVLSIFFKSRFSPVAFLIHQLLYPFYAVYFGLMANFGNYQWKGRSYPVQVQ